MEAICGLQSPGYLDIYHLTLYRKHLPTPAIHQWFSKCGPYTRQQHQHPVRTCYKCRFSDPTHELRLLRVGPNPCFNKPSWWF